MFAQNIKNFHIVDSYYNKAIEYVNIFLDDIFYGKSDSNGNFDLATDDNFNFIKFTHVSYTTISISKKNIEDRNTIKLEQNKNVLNEIKIKAKKTKKIYLFPQTRVTLNVLPTGTSIPYNFESATYIPNEFIEDYTIKKIIINTEKNQFTKSDLTKYIPFEVNLYTVDSISNTPKDRIFENYVQCKRTENEKNVTISLGNQQKIKLPKNGIFIVIRCFPSEFYFDNGYKYKPSFETLKNKVNSKNKQYSRLLNNNGGTWYEPSYSKTNFQTFNFGLEVIKLND